MFFFNDLIFLYANLRVARYEYGTDGQNKNVNKKLEKKEQ